MLFFAVGKGGYAFKYLGCPAGIENGFFESLAAKYRIGGIIEGKLGVIGKGGKDIIHLMGDHRGDRANIRK